MLLGSSRLIDRFKLDLPELINLWYYGEDVRIGRMDVMKLEYGSWALRLRPLDRVETFVLMQTAVMSSLSQFFRT